MDWSKFRLKLRDWYLEHHRELPWRKTKDAYTIWLSEIILQQTRVDQGLPYFEKFTRQYPKVEHLAQAPQDEVLRLWEGLGYYSRARNMHAAAKSIVAEHKGVFPQIHADIKNLKGVGDYTAAAIASFAFNLPHAVVDGNVLRVLSRLMAEETPINSTQGKKSFQAYADEFLDQADPATHNQAIMELGALQCLPKNPKCPGCPLKDACQAYAQDRVAQFPVKTKKTYDRQRYLNYAYIHWKSHTWLEQREAGIWKGLHQFPLIESESELAVEKGAKAWKEKLHLREWDSLHVHRLAKHKLSHQSLFISIWEIHLPKDSLEPTLNDANKIAIRDLKNFGLPRPLRKFLEENQLTLPLH